ncbi:uncharacterized protein B0H18DRAFT_1120580 [Fomitopsis serialis]|uniref:uncharacterized protein n=1 Tax=Fomitopsis serialis TaxID=139415 RepID=UPI002007C521|nr:uncharacterized protein B0H18DRAFT_1120580 [Neoantrodia serialis]KAH9923053.1 hypothetical protein B0H18DRAFT_1120580 [Neoantrodia serialis]
MCKHTSASPRGHWGAQNESLLAIEISPVSAQESAVTSHALGYRLQLVSRPSAASPVVCTAYQLSTRQTETDASECGRPEVQVPPICLVTPRSSSQSTLAAGELCHKRAPYKLITRQTSKSFCAPISTAARLWRVDNAADDFYTSTTHPRVGVLDALASISALASLLHRDLWADAGAR